jgi:hypothetical protein
MAVYRLEFCVLSYLPLLGRLRPSWEDIIKMAAQEVGCGDKDWIEVAVVRERWGHL